MLGPISDVNIGNSTKLCQGTLSRSSNWDNRLCNRFDFGDPYSIYQTNYVKNFCEFRVYTWSLKPGNKCMIVSSDSFQDLMGVQHHHPPIFTCKSMPKHLPVNRGVVNLLMVYRWMFWHRLTGKWGGGVVTPPKLLSAWPWIFYQMSISMGRCKICKKIEISHLVCKLWVCKVQKRSNSSFLEMYPLGVVTWILDRYLEDYAGL